MADPSGVDAPSSDADDPATGAGESGDPTPGGESPSWRSYFPYDAAYPEQADAIETIRETGADRGFALFEGACGTGKTLAALMAGISLVRDPGTDYERVLCLTSVNQQLRVFEEDLQAINDTLAAADSGDAPAGTTPEPVRGLTLIGKGSVCSYTDANRIDPRDIHRECEALREPVRDAIGAAEDVSGAIARLQELVSVAEPDPGTATGSETAGAALTAPDGSWTAPFGESIPTTPDTGRPRSYCPFYAEGRLERLQAAEGTDPLAIDPPGMVTPPDVRAHASNRGQCPHMVMQATIENAEVLVGNYYHAFDPLTVGVMTGDLLDESTFVVCDEAHMLVPRVRDLLSSNVSRAALTGAAGEVRRAVLDPIDQGGTTGDRIAAQLETSDLAVAEVERFVRFLEAANDWLAQRAVEALDAADSRWYETAHEDLPREVQAPLRDPEHPGPDEFSAWVDERDDGDLLARAADLGEALAAHLTSASFPTGNPERDTDVDAVGRGLARWWHEDNTQYFRTVTLERRADVFADQDLAWEEHYTGHLRLHNCLPSTAIASRLDEFGGGVLMSATLAPLDAYRREVGLADLAADRPVRELVHGLSFPPDNRTSLALKAAPFTYENRGGYNPGRPPETALFNRVREGYGQIIKTVVETTPGNVLVGMPSYGEAEWAAQVLREVGVPKDVLVDESSSNEATEELKSEFFAGEGKVLVTSLRGTLTEGVDYDGDKLAACLVCGVPIRSLDGPLPDAIRTAYESTFGNDNGFELAFTVPAVRKARQALGRVIRGEEEVGVRILADERYATTDRWDSVREMFPAHEREEYRPAGTTLYATHLEEFWDRHR